MFVFLDVEFEIDEATAVEKKMKLLIVIVAACVGGCLVVSFLALFIRRRKQRQLSGPRIEDLSDKQRESSVSVVEL